VYSPYSTGPKLAISVFAFGETRPRLAEDTGPAWATNRRIELVINGVHDVDSLTETIQEIREKYLSSADSIAMQKF